MKKKSFIDKVFEKIPPLLTWVIILFPLWGGFVYPNGTAYIILALNVYFVYKSISIPILLLFGVIRLRQAEAINWLNRLNEFDDIPNALKNLQAEKLLISQGTKEAKAIEFSRDKLNKLLRTRLPKFVLRWIKSLEKRKALGFINGEIKRLEYIKKVGIPYEWKNIHHVIIIPHWKEPLHLLRETLVRIKNMNYPTHRISIVLGAEARDPEGIDHSNTLKKEFEEYFENIWVNSHTLQPDEIIGKSSNMYSASKCAYAEATKLGWDLKQVTVTSCDADSQLPADYFAHLTYLYLTTPDPQFKYYTGAVLLYSNIWRLPFFARVKNSMSTLYNVTRLIREDKLVPFSTYTLSLWLVKEIGFWSADVTPEDFHTFFKGLFLYPSKVAAVPVFQRIMSDSAEGDNSWDTAKNNYLQERRWAWGISDDGWMIKNMIKNMFSKKFSLRALYMSAHAIWDHLSIGVTMLITFGGNMTVLVNPRFAYTVLGANLPVFSSFLLQLTLIFFIFTILLDSYIKPEPAGKKNMVQKLFGFVEWFLQPIIGIVLVVLPGIEAHTRLLFGRYLEYYLTKKK